MDRPVLGVLEQVLAWQILAPPDQRRETSIAQADLVGRAALAAEAETDLCAVDLDVAAAERRQAERAVQSRILVVTDADQGELQEPDDRRQDLLAGDTGATEVAVDALADPWQRSGELDEPSELRLVARGPVLRVVAMLLPPACIAAGRLHVPVRPGEIHTSVHAGGITIERIRETTSGSRITFPSRSR